MALFNSYKDFIRVWQVYRHSNMNSYEEDIWPEDGMLVWLSNEVGVNHNPETDEVEADGDQLIWQICPTSVQGDVFSGYIIRSVVYKVNGVEVSADELESMIRDRIKVLALRDWDE